MAVAKDTFKWTVGTKTYVATLPDVYGDAARTALGFLEAGTDTPGATHLPSIKAALEAGAVVRVNFRCKSTTDGKVRTVRGFCPTDGVAEGKLSDAVGKTFVRTVYNAQANGTTALASENVGVCTSAKVHTRTKIKYS